MSDYGDFCRDLREYKKEMRAKHGKPCPKCIELLPKAFPSILLPGQKCKIHKYKDARPRIDSYLEPVSLSSEDEQ